MLTKRTIKIFWWLEKRIIKGRHNTIGKKRTIEAKKNYDAMECGLQALDNKSWWWRDRESISKSMILFKEIRMRIRLKMTLKDGDFAKEHHKIIDS